MTRRGEFQIIADLFAPLARAPGALGLKDDAAIVTPSPGHDLVVTTDTVIADVHFRHDDPPDLVARKALRVNLSDLAAKGAKPLGVLHALALGAATDDAYLEAYATGLGVDLKAFDIALFGGDTTASKGALSITITAFGEVPHGTAVLRSGARAGDLLCVTGTIGDAAMGLRVLEGQSVPMAPAHAEILADRYRLPQPRVAFGQALRGLATAAADVSDGLVADVGHICAASGLAAVITWSAVPRSAALERALMDDPKLRQLVLGGGDDYEIAFTIPPERRPAVEAAAVRLGTPVTVIGRMVAATGGNDVTVLGNQGQAIDVPRPGYTHGQG